MYIKIKNIDELIKTAEPQVYRQPTLPRSDDGWSNDDNPKELDPGFYENSENDDDEDTEEEVYASIENIDELIMKFGDNSMVPTPEMTEFFNKRTQKHIDLVKKYCKKIHDIYGDQFEGIIERGDSHDESKWSEPERTPYILITWDYKCKGEGKEFKIPEELEEEIRLIMNDASELHVNNNTHHPEHHCSNKGKINREDRDEIPDEIIDATAMEKLDIAEMVADWCAMSEEKGNLPIDWADKNVGKRWKFNDESKYLIYQLITDIWS